jgi:hypothetical protein
MMKQLARYRRAGVYASQLKWLVSSLAASVVLGRVGRLDFVEARIRFDVASGVAQCQRRALALRARPAVRASRQPVAPRQRDHRRAISRSVAR